MKKFLSLLLVVCISFCVVGCDKIVSNSNNLSSQNTKIETNANTDKINKNIENLKKVLNVENQDIRCYEKIFDELEIVDFAHISMNVSREVYYVITVDGKLYKVSLDKFFSSNDKHYEEVVFDDDYVFVKFIRIDDMKTYIVDRTNRLFYFDGGTFKQYNPIGEKSDNIIEDYSGDYNNIFSAMGYCRIENNNIMPFNKNEIICSIPSEEVVRYVYDGGIKTNKNWYIIKSVQINKEECEKYVDVKPKYENKLIALNFNFNVRLCKNNGRYIIDENNTLYIISM